MGDEHWHTWKLLIMKEMLKDKSIDFIASSAEKYYEHVMACLKYAKECLVYNQYKYKFTDETTSN